MSREFGSYNHGYFADQMEYAASDCLRGRDELTRLWGEFFAAFGDVAYAIASSEACDSGPDYPILENIKAMPELEAALLAIKRHLEPYQRVAETAVREAVKDAQKTETLVGS